MAESLALLERLENIENLLKELLAEARHMNVVRAYPTWGTPSGGYTCSFCTADVPVGRMHVCSG